MLGERAECGAGGRTGWLQTLNYRTNFGRGEFYRPKADKVLLDDNFLQVKCQGIPIQYWTVILKTLSASLCSLNRQTLTGFHSLHSRTSQKRQFHHLSGLFHLFLGSASQLSHTPPLQHPLQVAKHGHNCMGKKTLKIKTSLMTLLYMRHVTISLHSFT